MTKHKKAEPQSAEQAPASPTWTPEELVAVAHLGPGVIGREMFEASQAYVRSSQHGVLGPATRQQA